MTKKSLKAFTLIEIMIALFVVSVGVYGVLSAFPLAVDMQKTSQKNTVAVYLCQEKIEDIISDSYDEIALQDSMEDYGFDLDHPGFKRITKVTYFDPDNPSVVPASDLGIKKIEVTVARETYFVFGQEDIKLITLVAER